MILGLYSWLFMTIVGGAHLLYVLLAARNEREKLKAFAISFCASALLFSPWLLYVAQHMQDFKRAYDWIQPSLSGAELLTVWMAIPYKALALFGFKTAKLGIPLLLVTFAQLLALTLSVVPLWN
ncbi:hypothetical protein, partial [Clavibacter michiganensis]|uniref:hypothetical protein n=1 Tax=Clavibacter michiganensis TaxID=28447 RepID=UPI00292D3541